MKTAHILAAGAATVLLITSASAQLYSNDFETDTTANWQFNQSHTGSFANFFFDYSTVGIPQAPSGTGTRGLKMEANTPGTGLFSGMSVSPLGESFTGDYVLTFDCWQNFNGPFPGGGSGSTQVTQAGIGAPTNQVQFPGSTYTGLGFGGTGDGGSATDVRAYNGPGAPIAPATGVYAAGNTAAAVNNTHAYYAGFGNVPAPAAQLTLFPQQTGNTAVGTFGMAWHRWRIEKLGNTVTWQIDGLLIATVTNPSFGGDNIFFGQFDINATSSTDPNARHLLFGLIDNVTVVPEPSSMAVLALGGLALLRKRRK
ncbi:MAG: PEP-CTERM sorting domain-containing protein [Armatimonadetes bacterium]|nr:PEP-CTERM sorting domain-containing protein [Armatimonadota bacterium]